MKKNNPFHLHWEENVYFHRHTYQSTFCWLTTKLRINNFSIITHRSNLSSRYLQNNEIPIISLLRQFLRLMDENHKSHVDDHI